MDPDRAVVDDVESNKPALAQGTVLEDKFVRANPNVQPPPPPPIPQPVPVFDELSCTPEECLKCVISLLKDSAYRWWKTLVSVVPKERVTWDFFQEEFRKKYISQWFIDKKCKEFLELKQGRMSVAEY
ncbi:uncharacterized protein LOC105781415 [Gossypium raimondii]|uniref:uncharacterized protein LOC105781415 n=1 Tax=Gossypium raimondii TaxID=29730 RepID=UPI00063AC56B|nr:uncharacterized protein LOC105781415 [Gossypium raimondii]